MKQCIEAFVDPTTLMTVNEIIEKLPAQRQNRDFLNVEDVHPNCNIIGVLYNKNKEFNALKESVRGNIDEAVRKREEKAREDAFL